ncbi:uncharacterized protein LOC117792950 [Drosophila innubila]|uniref:uncharacterized protein LOC117792950 n=1 Tax=Drosophila innubila TaxID=198719 RepID=UPI00148E8D53|nr:uncharacterized protein LOC117792950 [Drosophila innubila]
MRCEENERKLSLICDQVQLCMLPALKNNLDEVQLLPAQFESYHTLLQQELPRLYDLLQQNKEIFSNALNQELRAQLVLLLCELTASPTIYKLDAEAEYLLQNANQMLRKLMSICQNDEHSYIFNYYEQKLHKDSWKRQLGAVHGFVRYLEYYFTNDNKMSTKMLRFSLAMGLNVRECYHSDYKQLGIRVFSRMLSHSYAADIQQLNIQGVIYENLLRDAYTMDSEEVTMSVWNCLCQCLDHFTELDSFTWNQCDDMLERLLHNVTLSSNAQLSICLLQFITQLGYYFAINRSEVKESLANDFSQPDQLAACREVCSSLNVATNYRWAKGILQMLVLESEKLLQGPDVCIQMLNAMQRCYLVHIVPIPLPALNAHLGKFFTKFVAVLLECLVVHDKTEPIIQLTQQFIDIFIYQLNHSPAINLKDFATALASLQQVIVK